MIALVSQSGQVLVELGQAGLVADRHLIGSAHGLTIESLAARRARTDYNRSENHCGCDDKSSFSRGAVRGGWDCVHELAQSDPIRGKGYAQTNKRGVLTYAQLDGGLNMNQTNLS